MNPFMTLITRLGEASTAVQERRQRRQDWRTEVWNDRFDRREWGHITGEIPQIDSVSGAA